MWGSEDIFLQKALFASLSWSAHVVPRSAPPAPSFGRSRSQPAFLPARLSSLALEYRPAVSREPTAGHVNRLQREGITPVQSGPRSGRSGGAAPRSATRRPPASDRPESPASRSTPRASLSTADVEPGVSISELPTLVPRASSRPSAGESRSERSTNAARPAAGRRPFRRSASVGGDVETLQGGSGGRSRRGGSRDRSGTASAATAASERRTAESTARRSPRDASCGQAAVTPHARQPQRATDDVFRDGDPSLIDIIRRDVINRDLGVRWDDIAGLADAKKVLSEAVVLPALLPDFFTGIRAPWQGVLLFGPPGTGKTMLAKAVAAQAGSTFFAVTASSLLSKWHGESAKLVRTLFDMARHYSPSIVFFDEIDALMTARGSHGEHEATRQLKSELLTQIDGISSSGKGAQRVMVLCATNYPWDLDEAFRRRLQKRIYVPLPDSESRVQLFKLNLASVALEPTVDFTVLSELTEGYSGSDITTICRESALMAMRRVVAGLRPEEIVKVRLDDIDKSVSMDDLREAVSNVKSSVDSASLPRYVAWTTSFGSK